MKIFKRVKAGCMNAAVHDTALMTTDDEVSAMEAGTPNDAKGAAATKRGMLFRRAHAAKKKAHAAALKKEDEEGEFDVTDNTHERQDEEQRCSDSQQREDMECREPAVSDGRDSVDSDRQQGSEEAPVEQWSSSSGGAAQNTAANGGSIDSSSSTSGIVVTTVDSKTSDEESASSKKSSQSQQQQETSSQPQNDNSTMDAKQLKEEIAFLTAAVDKLKDEGSAEPEQDGDVPASSSSSMDSAKENSVRGTSVAASGAAGDATSVGNKSCKSHRTTKSDYDDDQTEARDKLSPMAAAAAATRTETAIAVLSHHQQKYHQPLSSDTTRNTINTAELQASLIPPPIVKRHPSVCKAPVKKRGGANNMESSLTVLSEESEEPLAKSRAMTKKEASPVPVRKYEEYEDDSAEISASDGNWKTGFLCGCGL